MNADDRELWRELVRRHEQTPRYDRKYWQCPSCGLGATEFERLLGTWAVCRPCATRSDTPLDDRMFDPIAGADEDGRPPEIVPDFEPIVEAVIYERLVELAHLHHFQTGAAMSLLSRKTGADPNADLADRLIDPWAGVPARNNDPTDTGSAPLLWKKLDRDAAMRCGLVLLEGEPAGIVLNPWRRLRARCKTADDLGEPNLKDALGPFYIRDAVERARWASAEAEVTRLGPQLLFDALRKLTAMGTLLATLRARRDDLNRQIARLEALEQRDAVTR